MFRPLAVTALLLVRGPSHLRWIARFVAMGSVRVESVK